MRSVLGLLLVGFFLVGCGSDDPESAPRSSPSAVETVLVSGTAGGGGTSTVATALDGDAAVATYLQQFRDPFASKVSAAIDRIVVPAGSTLFAAVVAIGCDIPPDAEVVRVADGIAIHPGKVASPHPECFAPVTTVALAAVPDDA